MTALAEALLAAQRQAIGALSKAYVAGAFDEPEDFCQALSDIGATDRVDQEHLERSLRIIQTYGAPMPSNGKPDATEQPASDRQMAFLASLADEKGTLAPDGPLTKAQASEAITALQSGTYDPDKWRAPF